MKKQPTTTSETLAEFANTVRGWINEFTYCSERQKKLEDEINDMEHTLELQNLSYHERAKLATELTEKLRERRIEKDRIEVLTPVLREFEDGQMFKRLEKAISETRRVERKFESRTYRFKAKDGVIENTGGKK